MATLLRPMDRNISRRSDSNYNANLRMINANAANIRIIRDINSYHSHYAHRVIEIVFLSSAAGAVSVI